MEESVWTWMDGNKIFLWFIHTTIIGPFNRVRTAVYNSLSVWMKVMILVSLPMKNQIDLEIYFYHYDKTKLRSAGGQQANLIVLSTETNCSVLARPGDIFWSSLINFTFTINWNISLLVSW